MLTRFAFFTLLSGATLGCAAEITPDDSSGEDELVLPGAECEEEGEELLCPLANGTMGIVRCVDADGLVWSGCFPPPEPVPAEPPGDGQGEGGTPLVLVFDREPTFTSSEHTFDLTTRASVRTDWPAPHTPWLALDRNQNGRIDDGSELFGSATVLANGGLAKNGFIALAELDGDRDGAVTPNDEVYCRLLVWTDRDSDRTSTANELSSLAAYGVVSLSLEYVVNPACDARRNCTIERARVDLADGRTASVVDVHLAFQ